VSGVVRVWNRREGYGLIAGQRGGVFRVFREDVPWHADLQPGAVVEFIPRYFPHPRVEALRVVPPTEESARA
jgi:cold shock CspA family protein